MLKMQVPNPKPLAPHPEGEVETGLKTLQAIAAERDAAQGEAQRLKEQMGSSKAGPQFRALGLGYQGSEFG